MKNKKVKIQKKHFLKYIVDDSLRSLIKKNFKHVKNHIIIYISISKLMNRCCESSIFITEFIEKIQNYFPKVNEVQTEENIDFKLTSIDSAVEFMNRNLIKIFCLDLLIISNSNNIDVIYEYNKLQIRMLLSIKKMIMKFFPLKLNKIIETFNKLRIPIYEYVEIN